MALYLRSLALPVTSSTSLPLPLTIVFVPETTRPYPVYVNIYRSSPVVRFVGGVSVAFFLFQFPRGVLVKCSRCRLLYSICYWFSWFAGFISFILICISSSSILGCQSESRVSFICAGSSIFLCSYCSVRILLASLPFLFSLSIMLIYL